MGDKVLPVEVDQENDEMYLHCHPVYPLPEEIKKMESSETACRYCGVSYLIFHEFQQLRTRLAHQEAELQELREIAQTEKAQREELELGRLDWEKALHLEVWRQAEEKERSMREELEEKKGEMEKALGEAFDKNAEQKRREVEEAYQKICEEKERQLKRKHGDLEAERNRREELERRIEEREKVLSDALQKANKNVDEQRKYLQQLEERLAAATSTKEKAEHLLGKEKQVGEILRGTCARQQQVLQATLSVLRSCGSVLTDVRGFLSQLIGAWPVFRCQILQYITQVFSVLREELKHSSEELQKMRDEKEHITQQLMEQRRQTEKQLSQQENSEKEHKQQLLRLEGELEEKHERWLSCQQKCDTIQEHVVSWQQREEHMARKCCTAEEEVRRLKAALEKVQQEMRELKREREVLIASHGTVLTKTEENFREQMASKLSTALEEQRTQNALHLREQMKKFRSEVEVELMIDRDKNQLLLLQYKQDSTHLQQKLEEREQGLRELKEELQQERRSMEVQRRMQDEKRRRREEEVQYSQQQEALQLSQAKAELQLTIERNAELQEEVASLQETVRRECEEREELTAALSKAQEELRVLQSPVSHQGSSRSLPYPMEKHTPSGNKHFHLDSQARVPLTRSSTSPNTLRPSPACTDKDRGMGTDGAGAARRLESWNCSGVLDVEKKQEGTLPRLKQSHKVKHKVSLVMRRKERL